MVNNAELKMKLAAIRSGDNVAFEELYNDFKTPIYTIIQRIVWDMQLAEEIMQEVFVKLFLSPPNPSMKNPRAYIFKIARNLAIDDTRKRQQHISLDDIENTEHQPVTDLALKVDVENALKALPEQECQIVMLRIIGELKFREIAEITNIPLGTVLWQYQKAVKKLQKIIIGGSL